MSEASETTRMSIGEHLDELRRRIIFALLYLTVGVTISMIYGTDLVDWALQPHYRALRAAQRDRHITRMEETLQKLQGLTSVMPDSSVLRLRRHPSR